MTKQKQAFLTCSFRLREPTAKKKAILDFSFQEYTQQVQKLLDYAYQRLDLIRLNGSNEKGIYTADTIRDCFPSNTDCQMPLASALKDGVFLDASSMIAGYLEAQKGNPLTGWPTAGIFVEDGRLDALATLGSIELLGEAGAYRPLDEIEATEKHVDWLCSLSTEKELASAVRRKARAPVRPLTFTRGRDFDLLLTSDLSAAYIYLPLLPNKNDMVEPVDFGQKNLLKLWSNDPGLSPIQAGKKRNGLLLPLELGKRGGVFHWQFHKFLMAMLDGNATPKSAKIIQNANGRYYINVSIAFDVTAPYEPQGYMGLSDNVLFSLAYAVVGKAGEVLAANRAEYEGESIASLKIEARKRVSKKQAAGQMVSYLDYKRKAQEEVLHVLINHILDTAEKHQVAIVMMDSDSIFRKSNTKKIKAIWAKAEQVIIYKCKLRGIPYRTSVFGAKAHNICMRCGGDCSIDKFEAVCTSCGGRLPVDVTKSINIARRVLYKKSEWEKHGGYREFHRSFK